MNKLTKHTVAVFSLIAVLTLCLGLLPSQPKALAQADNHGGHGHAAHAEDGSGHDDDGHAEGHDGHDHGSHTDEDGHSGHDGHEGRDDHEDDGKLRIDPKMMERFGIEVGPVGPGSIESVFELSGEVVFNADLIAHVTPNVPGIVREVEHSVGDRVEAGDLMAVLHSRELAAARSEYLSAQARLALARESLDRDERLLKDRVGTERQVLEARQAVREAEIALNLAEQNLHALGQDHAQIGALGEADDITFSAYELRAPISGVVIERHLTRGEKVRDDTDESPFVIADLSSVWVNITVYQRDLGAVRPGMEVTIVAGRGLATATGRIAFVSPSLDEHTRTATARVVLDNMDGNWRPGMFVTARLQTASVGSPLVLPRSAIQEVDGETVVFVRVGDAFDARPVVLGRESPERVEVLSGLEAGEMVVMHNGFALKAELNRGALEHAGHAH